MWQKKRTVGCWFNFRDFSPFIKKSDFQILVPNVRTFCAAQRFDQFNFGHYKKCVIDEDKCWCTLYSSLFVITKEKKKSWVRHSIVLSVKSRENKQFLCIIWILRTLHFTNIGHTWHIHNSWKVLQNLMLAAKGTQYFEGNILFLGVTWQKKYCIIGIDFFLLFFFSFFSPFFWGGGGRIANHLTCHMTSLPQNDISSSIFCAIFCYITNV